MLDGNHFTTAFPDIVLTDGMLRSGDKLYCPFLYAHIHDKTQRTRLLPRHPKPC